MREIKFRAWDKILKKILDVATIYFNEDGITSVDVWAQTSEGGFRLENKPSYQIILIEYVGLKDKNGKEIYEGDIISPGQDVISWCEKGAAFVIGVNQSLYDCETEKNFEVIGNIYENPELLK